MNSWHQMRFTTKDAKDTKEVGRQDTDHKRPGCSLHLSSEFCARISVFFVAFVLFVVNQFLLLVGSLAEFPELSFESVGRHAEGSGCLWHVAVCLGDGRLDLVLEFPIQNLAVK